MHLNDAGKMIDIIWHEIPSFYPGVEIDAFQIMPNHIHGIIILSNFDSVVGVGPRAYPLTKPGQPQGVAPTASAVLGGPAPTKPLSLPDVAHRFKSLTTHRYMDGVKHRQWPAFETRLWQRNYYEHVIRDDNDYESIVGYILINPFNWEKDEENITRGRS